MYFLLLWVIIGRLLTMWFFAEKWKWSFTFHALTWQKKIKQKKTGIFKNSWQIMNNNRLLLLKQHEFYLLIYIYVLPFWLMSRNFWKVDIMMLSKTLPSRKNKTSKPCQQSLRSDKLLFRWTFDKSSDYLVPWSVLLFSLRMFYCYIPWVFPL